MKRRKELSYTTLEFHEDFVVSKPKEGIVIKEEQVEELSKACYENFGNRKFAFISYRQNTFNINPVIYLKLKEINLKGIAVVCENAAAINTAFFEKNFAKVPFEVFMDLQESIEWVKNCLKNKKTDL